jgi:hypothetical protein
MKPIIGKLYKVIPEHVTEVFLWLGDSTQTSKGCLLLQSNEIILVTATPFPRRMSARGWWTGSKAAQVLYKDKIGWIYTTHFDDNLVELE